MIYLLEFITILIKMLQRFTRTFSTVKKTCLYDTLVESKGKMVEFAGIFKNYDKVTAFQFNSHQES